MNNRRSVSTRACRAAALTIVVLLAAQQRAKAAEIVITVKGTLAGGRDYFGIFGMGRFMPAGTPFTLVYTFDDAQGQPMQPHCPGSGSGVIGSGESSPATAVLTINGKSHTFGLQKDARSSAWRAVANICSDSELSMNITEGRRPLEGGVNIRLAPVQGERSLTQETDWRKPLSLTRFTARNTFNSFNITRPGNYNGGTQSYLVVSAVTVGKP